ncbi:MAG: hypothetical protein Q7R41_20120 [Phycisphaerales bacterium]|nr:hypothetical protein [Phycisphaerales bacterium]
MVAGFIIALLPVGGREPARAVPAELAKAVPNDVVAAYFVGGSHRDQSESGDRNSFQIATFLIDQAFGVGLLTRLDETTRAWLDALAAVSVVLEHPHAVMLFDISAEKTDEDGHRLAGLHAALVMHTRGRNELIERRIQHLLGSYTNRDETMLEAIEREGTTTYRLRDRRLADWVVLSWGRWGDHYVVAIGDGSLERVAATLPNPDTHVGRTPSVATDPWIVDGLNRLAAEDALLTVYLRFDELRRTSGPALAMKIDRVLRSLKIAGCERGLWAVGYAGRSVEIRQLLKTAASDEVATIAGAGVLDASNTPRIPDSATAFAAVDVKPSVWLDRARSAYLAGRSPTNQVRSRAYWRDIETRAGIRFADDIFADLSGPIIVHDFPKHALRLPPAWTIVAPISGDADRLRRSVDALFTTWQRELEETCSMRLRHDDDGVWHLFVGVEGPALMVTDRYLVISFAPTAVRHNVELLVRPAASAAPK